MQVRTERGILPESDSRQTEATLRRAISAVEGDNLAQAQSILEERIEVEQELLSQVVTVNKTSLIHVFILLESRAQKITSFNFQGQ